MIIFIFCDNHMYVQLTNTVIVILKYEAKRFSNILFHSERINLLLSFKECNVLLSFFFSSFWQLIRPKRMMRSFLKNVNERKEFNFLLQRT